GDHALRRDALAAPFARLPDGRFSASSIFSAVLSAATASRIRSTSPRVMRSIRNLPRSGLKWCSKRPRSTLSVDALFVADALGEVKIDQFVEGQALAVRLARRRRIAAGGNLAEQAALPLSAPSPASRANRACRSSACATPQRVRRR